jgi:hypothetical protein
MISILRDMVIVGGLLIAALAQGCADPYAGMQQCGCYDDDKHFACVQDGAVVVAGYCTQGFCEVAPFATEDGDDILCLSLEGISYHG